MAITGIAGSLLSSVINLALVSIPVQEARVAFDRMFEYSSLEKENTNGLEIENITSIDVVNIDFRFNGKSRLFNQVSFSLRKGSITCLVGQSPLNFSSYSKKYFLGQ